MKKIFVLGAASVIALGAYAQEAKKDADVENYMRSSLYTIILNSEKQNNYFEEETKRGENANEFTSMMKSIANTDAKKAANETETGSIFALPAKVFTTIEIPSQFNDHNLEVRVLDFDALRANMSDSDLAAAENAKFVGKKKKGGLNVGALAKGAAGIDNTGSEINNDFDQYAVAMMYKYFNDNNTGANMLAKWYNYNPEAPERWNLATIEDRGHYNFSDVDLKNAADDLSVQKRIEQTGFDMIGNTFVMVTNLRFRSYQAIVAEAQAAANAVGGLLGSNVSGLTSLAGGIASAAAGDGYTVQAVSSLYQLDWNEDANNKFGEDIFGKNATLEDLIASGICKMKFLGTEKSSSNIRQSLFSSKPISDLVKRATARAIDESIIKLQNNHEVFRTALPIIGGDGNGIIHARIGTKEGLNEKDEYEILEKQEDKNGKTVWKSVGTVKAVKGKIWNNAYGAEEELAENDKATDADRENVARGYTEFKGKKGDYKGYYLRLKKKKN